MTHIVEIYTPKQDHAAITRVCDSMDEALAISDAARHAQRVEIIAGDKTLMEIEVLDARVRDCPKMRNPTNLSRMPTPPSNFNKGPASDSVRRFDPRASNRLP